MSPAAELTAANQTVLSSSDQSADSVTWDSTNMYAISGGDITGFSTAYLEYVNSQAPDLIYVDIVLPTDINGTAVTGIGNSAFKSQQGS